MLPDSLKEAALSLGVPYHKVILKVIVPCGFAGILSGITLIHRPRDRRNGAAVVYGFW